VEPAFAPAAVVAGLGLELRLFAPGRAPGRHEAIFWSTGWLLLAVAVAAARRLSKQSATPRCETPEPLCGQRGAPLNHKRGMEAGAVLDGTKIPGYAPLLGFGRAATSGHTAGTPGCGNYRLQPASCGDSVRDVRGMN
jgi:hypothetical protein